MWLLQRIIAGGQKISAGPHLRAPLWALISFVQPETAPKQTAATPSASPLMHEIQFSQRSDRFRSKTQTLLLEKNNNK